MLMLGGGVFGRGPLGQGATSACRGWWCWLRKAESVQNPRKVLRGFFWTLGQGPRRRLSNPERVPWSARTGGEGQSRSFFGPAARPSVHHSCFFRTLDEE